MNRFLQAYVRQPRLQPQLEKNVIFTDRKSTEREAHRQIPVTGVQRQQSSYSLCDRLQQHIAGDNVTSAARHWTTATAPSRALDKFKPTHTISGNGTFVSYQREQLL
jgi:hypothetical protein